MPLFVSMFSTVETPLEFAQGYVEKRTLSLTMKQRYCQDEISSSSVKNKLSTATIDVCTDITPNTEECHDS